MTTPNHYLLSREQLAEASAVAGEGRPDLARLHLLFAAEDALSGLAARHGGALSAAYVRGDRAAAATRLWELGATPFDAGPVLAELAEPGDADHGADPLADRLEAGFGVVQALIDVAAGLPTILSSTEMAALGTSSARTRAGALASTAAGAAGSVVVHRAPAALPHRAAGGRRRMLMLLAALAVIAAIVVAAVASPVVRVDYGGRQAGELPARSAPQSGGGSQPRLRAAGDLLVVR